MEKEGQKRDLFGLGEKERKSEEEEEEEGTEQEKGRRGGNPFAAPFLAVVVGDRVGLFVCLHTHTHRHTRLCSHKAVPFPSAKKRKGLSEEEKEEASSSLSLISHLICKSPPLFPFPPSFFWPSPSILVGRSFFDLLTTATTATARNLRLQQQQRVA